MRASPQQWLFASFIVAQNPYDCEACTACPTKATAIIYVVSMPPTEKDFRFMAKIAQISQIGIEMAVPVGVGVGVDYWLGTLPWFTIIGAILGPTLGFIHLLALIRPPQDQQNPESK